MKTIVLYQKTKEGIKKYELNYRGVEWLEAILTNNTSRVFALIKND